MGSFDIPKWLKGLPLAPEFHPTDTEFADPIAYISKIEKEASAFGICKVIPPLPKPSKRYVFRNLNKSLSKCPELGEDVDLSSVGSVLRSDLVDGVDGGEGRAVFTTRHQELGQGVRRVKGVDGENLQLGVHKQVWQSGEIYTLEQFESKSKAFARSVLGMIKEVNPLVIEALFWKAASERPIYVEYANDVRGSGFAEPEGQFRYFRRQRRKRASYQSYRKNRENSDNKKKDMETMENSQDHEVKVASLDHGTGPSSETNPRSPTNSSSSFSEETSRSANRKSANTSCDMVGTAGWKLSNSPWNLQVIARSPGSLTRFMPDDIPGVTSPMVYIGMLFSWFAWHVEDHELHSMNFLHTGSPKTWYAVPGEHAHNFEEVICTEAYGGNIDHLAALTLLGEKTTLLPPDVIVSSGIPCCRLVQNPGEFVVTFPRAYHIGFSHGFNCGEAANFGTPQWLEVAKEAAVRRAAMNYLPMLSHQQLLYLLTMSFVSRVPRSLLPGVRCSRLRDRQREERELSVKKAFIEDTLKENNILSVLLGRNSAYRVVVWNADLLPSAFRETQLPGVNTSNVTIQTENASNVPTDFNDDGEKNDLFREMSLYMENINGLYMDDDDLSCDFQMDSGTLACVACGILGFPFMCVIQPSEAASIKLPTMDHYPVEGWALIMGNNHADSNGTSNVSVSDDCACLPHLSPPPKDMPTLQGWSTSCKFLQPRIFCLEHGVQIEELLRSKGGANILVICHSDYQKIKAHAAAIAKEMCIPYDYHEVSLEIGSQEELNLIDLAIDVEDHNECGEDWTSVLGINLQYCVKTRKHSPSKQVQHALALGGLLSEKNARSISSCIKWKSRRSRSKIKFDQSAQSGSCENVKAKKEEILPEGSEIVAIKQEKKLIQYMRRKFKVKVDHASNDNPRKQIRVTSHHDLQKPRKALMIKPLDHEIGVSSSTGPNFSLIGAPKMLSKAQIVHPIDSMTIPIWAAGSPVTSNVTNPGIKEQIDNQTLEDSINKMDTCANDGDASTCNSCAIQYQMKAIGGTGENDISCVEKCPSPHVTAAGDAYSVLRENHAIGSNFTYESHNMVLGQNLGILSDGDASTYWVSGVTDQHSLHVSLSLKEIENVHPGPSHMNAEVCRLATLDIEVRQGIQSAQRSNDVPCTSFSKTLVHQFNTSMEESREHLEISPGESNLHQEGAARSKNSEELILSDVGLISKPAPMDEQTSFRLPGESCAAPKLPSGRTSENDVFQEVQNCNGKKDQAASSCAELEKIMPIHARDVVCAIPAAASSQGNLCSRVTSDAKEVCSSYHQESIKSRNLDPAGKKRKRKKEVEQMAENKVNCNSFIRSPCEGLRPRAAKTAEYKGLDVDELFYEIPRVKERKPSDLSAPQPKKKDIKRKLHKCDLEGCRMSFHTRTELSLHKRNQCPYEGCKKRFSSHKYAMIHQRVHDDDRPLKCPWKGCSMTFKWAWARIEHIRVHTGEKPYRCKVEGCGRSFRFVSDFSRHRRRTGHCIETPASP